MIELFVFTYNEYNGKEKEQDPQSFPSNAWSLPTAVAVSCPVEGLEQVGQ
jgi:hypothetical protein